MAEGRGEQEAHIARITELRGSAADIRLTADVLSTETPITNSDLWRIREELDIEQFEFSRYHWAVKERQLFPALSSIGQNFDRPVIATFENKPLPAPSRADLIRSKESMSEWSHSDIDDFLLEAGIANLPAGRDLGSRRDRVNAIIQFAIENPSTLTAEDNLFTAFLFRKVFPNEGSRTGGAATVTDSVGTSSSHNTRRRPTYIDRSPNRVFVVHGQNETARNAVISFLQSLGLVGVVLHEQANMGRHLLTKFIDEAELVTFAVILMTDDDEGRRKHDSNLAPRARQNVILELGYFLAHLGQSRVCALITPGLETPSDFDGIVYIKMDESHVWQQQLERELNAAGMPIVR